MGVYTKITKIFENQDKHVYEICNNSTKVDCYALIDAQLKTIFFYRDAALQDCFFEYIVFDDPDIENKQICGLPDSPLFAMSLIKLIPAVRKGVFPPYLDKCS